MNHSASLLSIGLANVLVLLLAPVETLQRDTFLKAIAGAERENANLLPLQELSESWVLGLQKFFIFLPDLCLFSLRAPLLIRETLHLFLECVYVI